MNEQSAQVLLEAHKYKDLLVLSCNSKQHLNAGFCFFLAPFTFIIASHFQSQNHSVRDCRNENALDLDLAMNERMEADRKGRKIDYVTLNPKAVTLRLVWSLVVFGLGGKTICSYVTGEPFNGIFMGESGC